MGDVINRDKYAYERIKTVDRDGKVRHSAGNGDAVARALLSVDYDGLIETMKKNDLWDRLGKHVGSVNNGQLRMFVGNSLRALVRKGTAVVIGEHTVRKLDQRVALPEAPKPEKKAKEPKAEKAAKPRSRKKETAEAA